MSKDTVALIKDKIDDLIGESTQDVAEAELKELIEYVEEAIWVIASDRAAPIRMDWKEF